MHKHFKEKWVKWEKKGLVSFGSKDQDTFDLDHENERGEGLDVKLSSLSAELQLERERERRMKVEHELDEQRKQRKLLDAIPADGIYTPKHAPVKQELQDKLHNFKHRQNDHANRGRKTH